MIIFADTNLLFSAALFPNSVPSKALHFAVANHKLITCDYVIAELYAVIHRKTPERLTDFELYIKELNLNIVSTPNSEIRLISDPKDSPILNAAISANAEYIISGDKHFLSLDLKRPKTITPSEYLKLFT